VNLLGTDALGRDRLSRLILAARFSLLVGPLGALLAAILGIALGAAASHGGRLVDGLLMRAADAMMALPALVLILAARAAFPLELPPWRAAVLMIGIFIAVGWAEVARLSRGLINAMRQREFVLAARALGLSTPRILWRHILPNVARPLLVQFTVMLPTFLLAETALSFLGVGLQEPETSWGNMLAAASDLTQLQAQPFILLSPAIAILILVIGVRLIGDGMKKE
jgi:peptide/nickel transport system permease protein